MRKLLVISGGTRGIGKAIIYRFMEAGFDACTCARNEDDLQELTLELKNKFPSAEFYTAAADLSSSKGRKSFIATIHSLNRPVDILINNTGIFIPGTIAEEEEGVLEDTINTNLYSAYHLTRALLPAMTERKEGHIFNMCSTASITAYTNGGSYCISKFALYGMTKVLREELKGKNIRVTAILPGATLTASWEGVDLPPDRFMKATDVAEMILTTYNISKNSVVEEILIRPQLGDII